MALNVLRDKRKLVACIGGEEDSASASDAGIATGAAVKYRCAE
jgi:hypothetical protein